MNPLDPTAPASLPGRSGVSRQVEFLEKIGRATGLPKPRIGEEPERQQVTPVRTLITNCFFFFFFNYPTYL